MRSPIITGLSARKTVLEYEVTAVKSFSFTSFGAIALHFFTASRKWSGVVPQQPPTACTPGRDAISKSASENSSGATSKVVTPSTQVGSPALGFTAIGVEVYFKISCTNGSICRGPSPQLKPIISTPKPSSVNSAVGISAPVKSFPFSLKIMVTTTGKSLFSLAASTAALISYRSPMVSISTKSAPAFAPATTCSL